MAANPHVFLNRSLKGRDGFFPEEHDCIMNDYFQGCQLFPCITLYPRLFSFGDPKTCEVFFVPITTGYIEKALDARITILLDKTLAKT
jgi:hypothetical protein